MKKFHHKLFIIYPFLMLVLIAFLIFNIADKQSGVVGLETVPCIDPSKPFIQNYVFQLSLTFQGKIVALDPDIGHDPAQCLREIYTNDQSGLVYVHSVSGKPFTLADFFAVWRKSTNSYQSISVYENGKSIASFEGTLLAPNKKIEIVFK